MYLLYILFHPDLLVGKSNFYIYILVSKFLRPRYANVYYLFDIHISLDLHVVDVVYKVTFFCVSVLLLLVI